MTTGTDRVAGATPSRVVDDAAVAALRDALIVLRTSHGTGAVSASRTLNPLIDLWSLASAVDRSVAIPVESLLTVLVRRSLTTTDELRATADAVERALAAVAPSADAD